MFSPFLKRIVIDMLLGVALLLGILYFREVFFDFLVSLFHFYSSINLSSLAYTAMRFIGMFIPIIFIATFGDAVTKNKVLKILFIIIGVCYMLGNTWIFYYIGEGPVKDLFLACLPRWIGGPELRASVEAAVNNLYKIQYDRALILNYIVWDTYSLYGIIFSFIQGYLYITLGLSINSHRNIVVRKFFFITLLSFLLPMLHTVLINGTVFISSSWGKRNVMLIFENVLILLALRFSATSKMLWADIIW